MNEISPQPVDERREARDWSGVAAVVAALIGFMALLVSGYTALIQRQQVSAQVWPYLLIGYADPERSIIVMNKGVGPAQVRAMQVLVDDKPQRSWSDVVKALGLDDDNLGKSTISGNVLSAGEKVEAMQMLDDASYERFRLAAQKRLKISICYCSTLGECWIRDRKVRDQNTTQVDTCPAWPADQQFKD